MNNTGISHAELMKFLCEKKLMKAEQYNKNLEHTGAWVGYMDIPSMRQLIEAIKASDWKYLPQEWMQEYEDAKVELGRIKDPEWKDYLRLKQKFERTI